MKIYNDLRTSSSKAVVEVAPGRFMDALEARMMGIRRVVKAQRSLETPASRPALATVAPTAPPAVPTPEQIAKIKRDARSELRDEQWARYGDFAGALSYGHVQQLLGAE